ncbi:lactonase family protein [Gramella lutea]|uniref:Lactonase family protein n=1 Tax=Christiangramia lutea TaxID=1607951 RepID=A0A9X2ABK7_9FLAO|nr:lactonase family protein [Christiangramia lutea]MCH4823213.1 lactonase family protein [Christiangramia lutea]
MMRKIMIVGLLSIVFSKDISAQAEKLKKQDSVNMIYVGTYTKKEGHVDGKGRGIYLLEQHHDEGTLRMLGLAAELTNPSFVKVGKMGKYLYAVSELGPQDAETGYIHSFEILEDGKLKHLSKLTTGGLAPCHIALDRAGKHVFVSNYLGGIVMVYKINSDGSLTQSQELSLENPDTANAHSLKISGDNRYAYIADLGNDKIWIYHFDVMEGKLKPHHQKFIQLKKGAGPRHLSFTKNGSYLYSINELNSTVSAFKAQKDGSLVHIQDISSIPASYRQGNAAADIHIHPLGKFLYTSNRGHDSISIFEIDAETGKLSNVDYIPIAGKTPRNFAISPFGKFLYAASQDTGNLTTYRINEDTGKLKPIPPVFEVKTPVCLEFARK